MVKWFLTMLAIKLGFKALVSALMKQKNIAPEDLENGRDIYLKIPEGNLETWENLLTLMVSQFLRFFEQRGTNKKPILFMLDEFPRLGAISSIKNALTTLRSRNISICLAIQNLSQLDDVYSRSVRNIIIGNCSYKSILSAEDLEAVVSPLGRCHMFN